MKQPTAKDMAQAAGDLKAAMAEARETLQEIQSYWRDDPEMSREVSRAIGDFDDGMKDLASRLDLQAKHLSDDEKPSDAAGSGHNPERQAR